jgi:acetoin utilization deacetylase AcuC-like enzyme
MRAVHGQLHAGHAPPYLFSRGALGPAFESPERVEPLLGALSRLGFPVIPPVAHPDAALLRVHDPELVAYLRIGWAEARADGAPEAMVPDVFPHPLFLPVRPTQTSSSPRGRPGARCFDCSSPLLEGTWAAAREAVDVALTAADLIVSGDRAAYALVRPPGHHAGRGFYGGFCYFNSSAAAAAHLQAVGLRTAVLDLDIHHGNGTQAIFWDDPAVLTVSVHEHPDCGYPYFTGYEDEEGGADALGTNVNVTLPEGCDEESYLSALARAIEHVRRFEPDALVVPLGLDGLEADPLSSARLTAHTFARIGAEVGGLDRPTLIVQEGGYAVETIGPALSAFLGAWN